MAYKLYFFSIYHQSVFIKLLYVITVHPPPAVIMSQYTLNPPVP